MSNLSSLLSPSQITAMKNAARAVADDYVAYS
jgi:hypothetical protein